MRPTTLFSNHDEILQSTTTPAVDDAVTRATEEPVPSASIGARAFSMFNELPDDALRASRGFHMSAKLIVAIVAAGSFGAYVLAREAKTPAAPVAIEQPAIIEQVATPEPAPIVSEPAPAINEIAPVTTPAPVVKPAPVKRAATAPKAAAKAWDMPAPAAATIVVAPTAPVTPVERAPETPVIPVVAPDAPVAPAPVVEAPAEPVPPAAVPAPVTPAPSPAPQEPAAPAPAN